MRAILKNGLLVLVPEDDREAADLSGWRAQHPGHVLLVRESEVAALELRSLGPRPEACREPINVVSHSSDVAVRPVGNFWPAPFELDGESYASVESFWQGLKFPDGPQRRRVAEMDGGQARREGAKQGYGATVSYHGDDIPVGTWGHWQLMRRACEAKFDQNDEARAALLATGARPLTHVVKHDSRSIPGVIMADIWMRIRSNLRRRGNP